MLDAEAESGMGHIELARWADVVLVAPASANGALRADKARHPRSLLRVGNLLRTTHSTTAQLGMSAFSFSLMAARASAASSRGSE